MEAVALLPIKDWHTNSVLLSNQEGVGDLPITRIEQQVISVWKCSSIKARMLFLFTGKITFACASHNHPPISLMIGEYISK